MDYPFIPPTHDDLNNWLADDRQKEIRSTIGALLDLIEGRGGPQAREMADDLMQLTFCAGCVHTSDRLRAMVSGLKAVKEASKL